ncbi:hypothetical protein VTO73DRAFT_4007 [Trametes versicolor]
MPDRVRDSLVTTSDSDDDWQLVSHSEGPPSPQTGHSSTLPQATPADAAVVSPKDPSEPWKDPIKVLAALYLEDERKRAVTEEWLRVFAHCATSPHPSDTGGGNGMLVSGAARKDASLSIVYEQVVHETAPFRPGSDVYPAKEDSFWVASVRNTAFLHDYMDPGAKPTRAQYAWLCAVMPGEPHWYRCILPRREYVHWLRRAGITDMGFKTE